MSDRAKTPWGLFDAGDFIYINEKDGPGFICAVNVVNHHAEKCRANARHIVHCVNNMPKVVEALDELYKEANAFAQAIPPYANSEALIKARALLASLEAEKGGEL